MNVIKKVSNFLDDIEVRENSQLSAVDESILDDTIELLLTGEINSDVALERLGVL